MFIRGKSAIYYRICASSILLIVFGTVFLLSSSASYSEGEDPLIFFIKRIIWIVIGLLFFFALNKTGIEKIQKYSLWIFLFSLILLPLPRAFHQLRWIKIGPFSFQPAELVKLTFVIFLANFLTRKDNIINNWKTLIIPVSFFVLITGILQLQKDLGTVMIIGLTLLFLLFLAGLRVKYVTLFAVVSVVLLAGLILLFPYRIERVKIYLNPGMDPKGKGYQIIQSKIALGSGGFFGKGLGAGERKLNFLPVANKDYIYAIVGEELGFIGTSLTLILFAILVFSTFQVSKLTKNKFEKYLTAGIGGLFGFQFLLHAFVVLSIVPSKGTTLPFFSKGGSSFLVNFLTLGLLIIISRKTCLKVDLDEIPDF